MNEYEQAALRILEAFKGLLRRDAGLARLNARIDAGLATYEDAERLSSLTGRELGELITRELLALFPSGPIPREAAEAILPPALRRNYEVVSKAAERVQKALNDRAGLGLAPVRPQHRQERDDNLITYTATQEDFASDAKHFVQLTENNSMMIVDDAVRDNADFHFGAGLSPRIVRKMRGRACAFCRERAGTFDYSVDMNKEVFRRHPNCHCTVEYNPGNGSRKRQNVHSKEWRNATGTERLRDFAEGKAEQLRAAAREKAERLRAMTEAGSDESSAQEIEQRRTIGLPDESAWEKAGKPDRDAWIRNQLTSKQKKAIMERDYSMSNFPTKESLEKHFKKHYDRFDSQIEPEEYVRLARELLSRPINKEYPAIMTSDGAVERYDIQSNLFVVCRKDGTLRTCFRPIKGIEYWRDEYERN